MERLLTTIKTKRTDGTYTVIQRIEGADAVENFYGITDPSSEFKNFKKKFKQCDKTRVISPNMISTSYTNYKKKLNIVYKIMTCIVIKDNKRREIGEYIQLR